MKKLICIILIFSLVPVEAFALRPMAGRLSANLSLKKQLEEYAFNDMSPRLTAANSSLIEIGRRLDRATVFNLARASLAIRPTRNPTITYAIVKCLKKDSVKKLISILQQNQAEGLHIDPCIKISWLNDYLEGDGSRIYTCIVKDGEGKRVLAFRTYDLLVQAIDYMDNIEWSKIPDDEISVEKVLFFLEGLDVQKEDISKRCVDILRKKILEISKGPNRVSDVFEQAFCERPQHKELLARHILRARGCGKQLSDEKASILVEELLKLKGEKERKVFISVLLNAVPRNSRVIEIINRSGNIESVRRAAGVITKITRSGWNCLEDFLKLLVEIDKDRRHIIMHEFTRQELEELRHRRDDIDHHSPFWQGATIQPPDYKPRIASFGDTWRFFEGRVEKYDYEMELDKFIALAEAFMFLRNPEELVRSAQDAKSIFENISPDMLKAISDLFFIEDIEYVTGQQDAKRSFNNISDMMLRPIGNEEFSGLSFKNIPAQPPPEGLDYKFAARECRFFSDPGDFLRQNSIEIEGGLTSGGNNIYGRIKGAGNKRVVFKIAPPKEDYGYYGFHYEERRVNEIRRESELLEWISSNKDKIGLECVYPQPVRVSEGAYAYVFRLSALGNFSPEYGQEPILNTSMRDCLCFCYIADEDNFVYLDDHRQEYNPEQYLRRSVRDLARLARCGIFLEGWPAYGHTLERTDFDWSFNRGSGTMPKWLSRQWYTNYRRGRPADLGHTVTKRELKVTESVNVARKSLGDIPLSAIITEAANLWKHNDYPFKFFYAEERDVCREFIRGAFRDLYKTYSGANADILDILIDWNYVADRFMYEVGSVIRQENFPDYDLGYGHGVFPCPELIRATFITVTLAMIEKSVRDKAKIEWQDAGFANASALIGKVGIAIDQAA